MITHLNNLGHLLDVDHAIAVDIVHAECPLKLFLGSAAGCYMNRLEELL